MPKNTFDSKAESLEFQLLPDGDYIFEVVSVDVGISTGRKTAGSEVIDLKCQFFNKDGKRLGQWTESLIFHQSCAWKVSVFTKCANMLIDGKTPSDGAEIDYSPETMLGLRGWCSVGHHSSATDATKVYNDVKAWLTNKEKLPRAHVAKPADPFAAKSEDNPENW